MNVGTSVVIPSYNAVDLLEENLPFVLDAVHGGDEVIVIDDASTDQTVVWMINTYRLQKLPELPKLDLHKHYLPHISDENTDIYEGSVTSRGSSSTLRLVVNKQNCRFAAACNKGVALARHDWVLLLNNDVKPEKNCLNALQKIVTDNKNVFAVGCIEYEDERRLNPSGKNKLWFERGLFLHSKADEFAFGETAWVSGGSGLFSKSKWMKLLGFDLKYYPAYWEDVDVSYRARKMHWQILFTPQAVVFHKHETTNADVIGIKKIEKISWRHAQYFTWKNGRFSQKLQFIFWLPYWTIKRYLTQL